MRLILLVAAVVLAIVAAILGWSFGPHHCFALAAVALACLSGAALAGEPAVVGRL